MGHGGWVWLISSIALWRLDFGQLDL
ncbi:uncharacterized protein G2W53_019749 [Senna tora]|uniref:Uncharacterized protein n=1 Tax=Senna tora TaxID=362788 RepID=A0A834TU17_9FABA|nr:uncharacterized protein G2W53_019749 [Senna tora]